MQCIHVQILPSPLMLHFLSWMLKKKKKKKKTTFRNWKTTQFFPQRQSWIIFHQFGKKANNKKQHQQQALQRKKLAANYNNEKNPKNRNCKLCTYIYIFELLYISSTVALLLLLPLSPPPPPLLLPHNGEKKKPKRKQRTRRNYERKGSTQTLTKHGTWCRTKTTTTTRECKEMGILKERNLHGRWWREDDWFVDRSIERERERSSDHQQRTASLTTFLLPLQLLFDSPARSYSARYKISRCPSSIYSTRSTFSPSALAEYATQSPLSFCPVSIFILPIINFHSARYQFSCCPSIHFLAAWTRLLFSLI